MRSFIYASCSLAVWALAANGEPLQRNLYLANPAIHGNPVNPNVGAPNLPIHCHWTTSPDCGNVPVVLPSIVGDEPSLLPRKCLWETSEECGTAPPSLGSPAENRPRRSFAQHPCTWTTSVECGTVPGVLIVPKEAGLIVPSDYSNFCAQYYPICVVTYPEDGNQTIIVTPTKEDEQAIENEDDTFDKIEQIENFYRTLAEIRRQEEERRRQEAERRAREQEQDNRRQEELPKDADEKTSDPTIVQNPFTLTPLRQPLNLTTWVYGAPYSVNAPYRPLGAPTAAGMQGAYEGWTRLHTDGNPRYHGGFDDGWWGNYTNERVYFESTIDMYVSFASPEHKDWGGMVQLVGIDPDGNTFKVGFLHLNQVDVRLGQKITKGEVIGRGYGFGRQFYGIGVGTPHVHWSVEVNGQRVDPLLGFFAIE